MKPTDHRIAEIQIDEDEYFVELKAGFCLRLGPHDIQHCFGARTKTEVKMQLKDVVPCRCESCISSEHA